MNVKILSNVVSIVLLSLTAFVSSCSSHTTTTTSTTERYTDDGRVATSDGVRYSDSPTSEIHHSETKTVEAADDHDDGLFGIIGNVIALPFRVVGAALSALF